LQADRLADYLRARLPAADDVRVANVSRFSVGASRETWSFDAAWNEGGRSVARGFILRRDTDGGPVETDLQHEYRVYCALQGTTIPVPRSYWYEADPQWAERPFFVMGRIDGCESSPQVLLFDKAYAAARAELGENFVRVIANLHRLDWKAAGFGDFMPAPPFGHVASSQVDYWEEVLDRNELEPHPLLRGIIQWLREHLPPAPKRLVVVHGDMRVGNFLAATDGHIEGMLDWELAHLGDPLEDVGWAMHRTFAFGFDSKVGGLLERGDYLRRYEELTGTAVPEEAVQFWEVFSGVKLATILHTGGRAFADGRTRSMTMLMLEQTAKRGALMALQRMEVMGAEK
jgi:aminoglycoside phosphotransferase (APT) family kinase protein